MGRFVIIVVLVLIPVSFAHAQIPAIERAALIALYNDTDGANWTNYTNWLGPAGTECTWFGVECRMIDVNPLNMYVYALDAGANNLSGIIPPELGNLSGAWGLFLGGNNLIGSIPPELGSLPKLQWLSLHSNHLSGTIPPELGNLPSVTMLSLCCNQLDGEIPAELESLSTIQNGGLGIGWNALHTDNASLRAFLTSKHWGFGDWESSQTISPVNVTVHSVGTHTVWLSWDAVNPQGAPGGYHLFIQRPGSGSWESVGWTESKWTTTFPVTGLDPGMSYDIAVTTYTDPHFYNPYNRVTSDISSPEMVTTSSFGCAQPVMRMAGAGPFTLSLIGTYDSYLWSTGETTPTIEVNPPADQWFWVTVTSAGGCEESAATLVDPNIFADGFESGNTLAWSSSVP